MSNPADLTAIGEALLPQTPYPLDDDPLDQMLKAVVVACTGIPGTLVRARWQVVIPTMPDIGVDWCALGVLSETADAGPWIGFDPVNEVGPYVRHATMEIMATFYGDQAKANAALLRDGLGVPQNTEVLRANDFAFVGCGPIIQMHELLNQQWWRRQDITITLRRKISRSYKTLYIAVAEVHLIDDTTVNDTIIVPPGSTLEP